MKHPQDGCHGFHSYAAGGLQPVHLDDLLVTAVRTCKHKYVIIADFLFLVRKFEELLIYLVQLFLAELDSERLQTVFQCRMAAAGREDYGIGVQTYVFRIYDFIGGDILEHSVLMYAGGMGKGIATHYGLVGLHRHIHQVGNHTAHRINPSGIDIGLQVYVVVGLDDHRYFLKGGVAGPLAHSVDGHLTLARSVQESGHSVGGCHSEVGVAGG